MQTIQVELNLAQATTAKERTSVAFQCVNTGFEYVKGILQSKSCKSNIFTFDLGD